MAKITFYWLDPDGGSIQLGNASTSHVKAYSGLGMAPVHHFLEGIPSQHRQRHRGLKFRPRVVQLGIWDVRASAQAQDERQEELLAALNSDRGEGRLKIVLSDGITTRYLDCYVQEGPDFASEDRPGWGEYQFYVVRFVAPDPFLYDPTPVTESGNFNGATPVNISVTNDGHMDSYPILTISATVNTPKVMLVTTGEYVQLNYNLTAGHIDVDCGEGTVVRNDTIDAIDTLTKASTLFAIPRGDHTLRLTAASGAGAFSCSFFNRFLGLGIPEEEEE